MRLGPKTQTTRPDAWTSPSADRAAASAIGLLWGAGRPRQAPCGLWLVTLLTMVVVTALVARAATTPPPRRSAWPQAPAISPLPCRDREPFRSTSPPTAGWPPSPCAAVLRPWPVWAVAAALRGRPDPPHLALLPPSSRWMASRRDPTGFPLALWAMSGSARPPTRLLRCRPLRLVASPPARRRPSGPVALRGATVSTLLLALAFTLAYGGWRNPWPRAAT